MSIVPLNSSDEKNISCFIQSFLLSFHIAQLLRKCGIAKIKGVPVMELFTYILSNAFRMGSFYMQKSVGNFHEGFSKNTYYRFFQNAHANWLRFTTLLSERIVNRHLRPLTSDTAVRTASSLTTPFMNGQGTSERNLRHASSTMWI